jgi:ABC-type dipeptide/oligopeptide/nickel transport system permease subunit
VSAIERHEPTKQVGADNYLGPTPEYWFGTDKLGRDTWARTLEGVRVSVSIGVWSC